MAHPPSTHSLSPHEARAVAVKAGTDPRTVLAYLAGKPVRSTTLARIVEALRSLGLVNAPSNDTEPRGAA